MALNAVFPWRYGVFKSNVGTVVRNNEKEKAVIEAWKAYLDLLGDKSITGEQWGIKRVDLLVELLHKMAVVLDYDFDKTHLKIHPMHQLHMGIWRMNKEQCVKV